MSVKHISQKDKQKLKKLKLIHLNRVDVSSYLSLTQSRETNQQLEVILVVLINVIYVNICKMFF